MTLSEFLERFPWSGAEKHGAKPMDYLWHFSLQSPVADLWPFLIDTSTFNKLLGLPLMTYAEKNGRLFGTAKNAGIVSEWEEVPWEWEYHKGLNNARIYSRGFAKYVRSRYLLEAREGGTDLYVYFGWIPRGLLGWLLLKIAFPSVRRNYAVALGKIEEAIRTRAKLAERQRAYYELAGQSNPAVHADIAAYRTQAVANGADPADLDKLIGHLRTAPEEELVRIRLKPLAGQWGIDLASLVRAALHATKVGLLSLSWDVTCPHCRGVRKSVDSLGDIPAMERCDACDITFSPEDMQNMEVIFHVNPEIRKTEKKFYCAAEPATKAHIYVQRRIPAMGTLKIASDLEAGEYRIRVSGNKQYLPLSVGTGSASSAIVGKGETPISTTIHPQIIFENPDTSEKTLVVERRDEDNDALRPAELFGLQLFRDFFGNQALAEGLRIELGRQNVLFTDIVGSTKLYLDNGDGEAFRSVRKHFQKIYEIVRMTNGAVVKTIGDAAMAVFADPLQCARAAVLLQRTFRGAPDDTGGVLLRISIHSGPCLAVNLNNGVDYFGNTVNYAAKLQQLAGAHEIAFSPEFYVDQRVAAYFRKEQVLIREMEFSPGWASASLVVYQGKVGQVPAA